MLLLKAGHCNPSLKHVTLIAKAMNESKKKASAWKIVKEGSELSLCSNSHGVIRWRGSMI
jgi:hypothetical protein